MELKSLFNRAGFWLASNPVQTRVLLTALSLGLALIAALLAQGPALACTPIGSSTCGGGG